MADYIEHSYRANASDGASLIAQGREYIIDSVVTCVSYTAHLHDALETIIGHQEAGIDKMATNIESVSIRANAIKFEDGVGHLRQQLSCVPTWPRPRNMRGTGCQEIPRAQLAAHIRKAFDPEHTGTASFDGICYNLSSLDSVGRSMASEEDRMQDEAARALRQVRRPSMQAAGIPPCSPLFSKCLCHGHSEPLMSGRERFYAGVRGNKVISYTYTCKRFREQNLRTDDSRGVLGRTDG